MRHAYRSRFAPLLPVLVAIMAAAPPALAQTTNRLGWSADQAQAWQAMHADNHQYWQDLLAKADNPDVYADEGVYDGLCYLITGDEAYAQRAWDHNSHWRGRSYNPGGELPVNSNVTRHRFSQLSLLYSWIADALEPADKAAMADILDFWTDMVTGQGDINWGMTSMADSDEVIGNYFGLVLYALAIEAESPGRAAEILDYCGPPGCCNQPYDIICIGGVDATGIDRSTWRNTIAEYATEYFPGGLWMESTAYNNSTLRYLLQGVDAINAHYGEDKFPEVTAVYEDLATALLERAAPGFDDLFQWGAMDSQHLHNFSLFHGLGLYGYVHHVTNDPRIAERYHEFYEGYRPSTGNASMFFNLDPAAPRQTQAGFSAHDAHGRGVAYWHEGWEPNDSFFASTMFNAINVHHGRASFAHFNLWRQGGWAVVNPRGYLPHHGELPYMNTLMVYGGIGRAREAWGRYASEAAPGYLYHLGGTGGQFVEAGSWDPPPEVIHEWTRTQMLLHHDDGSDSIVLFDRLNLCGPIIGDEACITPDEYDRFRQSVRDWIDAAEGKHQWIIHMPTGDITVEGDEFSWPAPNGETVRLTTYMDGYTHTVYDELAEYNAGAPLYLRGWFVDEQLKYQLRLVPDEVTDWTTMLHVVHVGSEAVLTRLGSTGTLDTADGVLIETGGTRTGMVLNATRATPPDPTPNDGNFAAHDPLRKSENQQLHFFTRGFVLTLPAGAQTLLRVADLDPAREWTIELDSNGAEPLVVSAEGLAEIVLGVLAEPVTLTITASDLCRPDLNNDGAVDAQDFLLFLDLWNAGDPAADWTGDGTIDTRDFLAFLTDWSAGCA